MRSTASASSARRKRTSSDRSKFAYALGDEQTHAIFAARATYWKNVFNPKRNANGATPRLRTRLGPELCLGLCGCRPTSGDQITWLRRRRLSARCGAGMTELVCGEKRRHLWPRNTQKVVLVWVR